MKNKVILISLLIASSSVLAEQSVATSATPAATVESVEATGQPLEKANAVKNATEAAPAAAQDQTTGVAKEAAKAKVDEATPAQVKQGAETLKKGKKTAKKVKMPKSTSEASEAVEGKVKEKAAEKALEMVH
jgi:hypothetical protein